MSKQNGKAADKQSESGMKVKPEILARFNPADKQYVTQSGHTLRFREISAGVLDRAQERIELACVEPDPPMIEIDHGKGRVSMQANVKDDWYLLQHSRWRKKVSRKLAIWTYCIGIENEPPPIDSTPEAGSVFEAMLALETPETLREPYMYKYLYISSLLNSEEYSFLFEAIIGQATITQLGLQEAAADFPG